MLPVPAQHRLYRHVPGNSDLPASERAPLDIDYYTFDGSYINAQPTLDVFWAEEDYTPQYPAVALDLGPTAIPRWDGQTLDEWVRRVARPDDPTIAYEEFKGTKLRDTLTLTVMVRDDYVVPHDGSGGHPPGATIPRSAFAKELAQALFMAFRFDADYLNEPGVTRDGDPLWAEANPDDGVVDDESVVDPEDWAVPMNIEPVPGRGIVRNPAMVDEQHVDRYNMQFRVEYELTQSVLVEAVQAVEYDVRIDGETVTRERVGTPGPFVTSAVFPTPGSSAE